MEDPRQLMVRSQRAVARCATELRITTDAVAAALEGLSKAFNGFGLPQETNDLLFAEFACSQVHHSPM
jgi:hypothetical protein